MASPVNSMVANPGLPMTAAMHYGQTMMLYTGQEKVECVVDGAPPGPNGRLFIVEVDDPTEVPYEAGRFILEHLKYTGVVRVDEIITRDARGKRTGVEYDLEKAKAESEEIGKQYDDIRWAQYVSDMMDDYVSRKDGKTKAVPKPPASIARIMERRSYKLADYGIQTLGFEDPSAVANKRMKSENEALKEQMAVLQKQMAQLLAGQTANKPEETGEPEPEAKPAPTPRTPRTPRTRTAR